MSKALHDMDKLDYALKDVELAFRQLEFAIKLMCYCELGHIDLKKFDTDITILLKHENVGFSAGGFEKDSIIMTSQMLVGTAFGVSAIILDAMYDAAGIKKNIKSREPKEDLRTLVYMVRCAFAHNIAAPVWEAREPDFSRKFCLPLTPKANIDLSKINGASFEYDHIGGFAQWYKIKDAVIHAVHGM